MSAARRDASPYLPVGAGFACPLLLPMRAVMRILECNDHVVEQLVDSNELGFWRAGTCFRRRYFKGDTLRLAGIPFNWEETSHLPALLSRKEFSQLLGLNNREIDHARARGRIHAWYHRTATASGHAKYRRTDVLRIAGHPDFRVPFPDFHLVCTETVDSAYTFHCAAHGHLR